MSLSNTLSGALGLVGNKPSFTLEVAGTPLRVVGFTGHERISSPFEYIVEVASSTEFDPETMLGSPASLAIRAMDEPRLVHGLVSAAEYVGHTRHLDLYQLTITPFAHRLLHRSSSRIFQEKTTQQIVTEVLTKAGLKSDWFRFSLVESYAPRDYCVQYRETDLAFVSRLLEEDGIYYYFLHEEDKHVWVMSDTPQGHEAINGDNTVWFQPPEGNVVQNREHIHSFRFGGRVRTGKIVLRDLNLHKPSMKMEVEETAKADPELEVYDSPAEYQEPGRSGPHEGKSMAKIRLEEVQATRKIGTGTSDVPRLNAGATFKLIEHTREELNGDYRLIAVEHRGRQPQVLDHDSGADDNTYSNSFTVTELKVPFRPARTTPRPSVRGVQTATVVGPESEEIHTDKHGRVRVQFHWDRDDKFDETSATWVRVSQLWAGSRWGAMFLPRIGHEVLVDFLEGDPDRPIITGRIYHGENLTPYPLPDQKTRSTIKSDSSLGGGGYNELRYEDLKEHEQIFLHAERNIDVRVNHNAYSTVWDDSHNTVGHDEGGKGGNSYVQLFQDHHLKIHRHTKAHLGGDVELQVGGIDGPGRVDIHIHSDKLEWIDGDRHEHTVKNTLEKVDGSVARIVGDNEHVKIGGLLAVETGGEVHFKSSKIVLDAGSELTIQGPGGHITINSSGIFLAGTMIYLNSGGSPAIGTAAAPGTAADARDAEPIPATPSERGSK